MQVKHVTLAAMFALALSACSKNSTEQPSEKPTGVIPQAQLDALNKAKNVENVLKQDEQKLREQSEAAQ
jgi:type IV pilus biogenesis protein CpaD/CtpE